jgi:hypothetical protein
MSEIGEQAKQILLNIGKAAGVDVEAELAERQIYEFGHFKTMDRLEEYARSVGLIDDTPRTVIHVYTDSRGGHRIWESKEQHVTKEPISLASLLETAGDMMIFEDDPNDFTVGMVLELPDGRQLAIRYTSEECELINSLEDLEDLDRERELEYLHEFDVVICGNYQKLSWGGISLTD